ncbi:hypothetical protein [Mycobacterium sp. NPDC050041]|uniref:hypothetical protein n=1 Tax=Mycobacterium sp. NPDC050041 TaxID=3364293 RepID=UPI003C2B7CF9
MPEPADFDFGGWEPEAEPTGPTVTSDETLRRLFKASIVMNIGIPVTLFLPWGVAAGSIASRKQFDYTLESGLPHNYRDIPILNALVHSSGNDADDAGYFHLRAATTWSATNVQFHVGLRVRLADVSAWRVGLPKGLESEARGS